MNEELVFQIARDQIERDWTSAEEDWKQQAFKNLKIEGRYEFSDEDFSQECIVVSTFYINKDEHFIHKRCDVNLEIMTRMRTKES